mgnify:CR=1 FL=1
MPNVKIFVEEALFASKSGALRDALLPLRDMLCKGFKVDVAACQFAVTPVMAMPDLPLVNVEMHILPRADRTRDAVRSARDARPARLARKDAGRERADARARRRGRVAR